MSWTSVDLYDDYEGRVATCSLLLRSYGGRDRFYGPIRTVRCYEDNSFVRKTLEQPGKGCVLVVDGNGSTRCALMGDMIAEMAAQNGWAGVIINGCVRDTLALRQIDLGVLALGANPAKSHKADNGLVDEPVRMGDVLFEPGMWIYCDQDGILVSHQQLD